MHRVCLHHFVVLLFFFSFFLCLSLFCNTILNLTTSLVVFVEYQLHAVTLQRILSILSIVLSYFIHSIASAGISAFSLEIFSYCKLAHRLRQSCGFLFCIKICSLFCWGLASMKLHDNHNCRLFSYGCFIVLSIQHIKPDSYERWSLSSQPFFRNYKLSIWLDVQLFKWCRTNNSPALD